MAYRFNPPPGWPQPPQGWRPPAGWQPDPSWPAPPEGWEYWVADAPAENPVESAAEPAAPAAPLAEPGVESVAEAAAPAAPELDAGSAPADAAEAEQAADPDPVSDADGAAPAGNVAGAGRSASTEAPATTQLPVTEAPGRQHPGDDPTQQFSAGTSTRQLPQWGGVPQPPPPGPASPHAQQPQHAPPPQPQWGTGSAGQAAPAAPYAGGAPQQSPPPPYAGGHQQQSPPPPGAAPAGPQASMPPVGGGYSAAPPPGSGPQFGGPSSSQPFQQAGPFGPGQVPPTKNRTPLIVGGIVTVIVVVLLVVLAVRLINGDDEAGGTGPTPTAAAPSTDPADDPTTPAQTDDPSDQPTDDPTDQPTDDPTGSSGAGGTLTALAPGDPAIVTGASGEPEVEVALVSVERNWQPDGAQAVVCPDPVGEYLALEFEFTTLPALAEGSGTYSFAGFEIGLANDNGTALEASGVSGLFCLGSDRQAPVDMGPGETFTGWAVVDAPAEGSQVLWESWLDFTGEQPTYAWSIADF